MTRQSVLRSSLVDRRQPLLGNQDSYSRGGKHFAEVVGGTTAECTVICYCCPCGITDLLFLAVYKVPVGLCRKALRSKHRCRLMEKGLLLRAQSRCKCECDDTEMQIHIVSGGLMMINLRGWQLCYRMELNTVKDAFDRVAKKQKSSSSKSQEAIDQVGRDIEQTLANMQSIHDPTIPVDHKSILPKLKTKLTIIGPHNLLERSQKELNINLDK